LRGVKLKNRHEFGLSQIVFVVIDFHRSGPWVWMRSISPGAAPMHPRLHSQRVLTANSPWCPGIYATKAARFPSGNHPRQFFQKEQKQR
jgi:hypothetical protein